MNKEEGRHCPRPGRTWHNDLTSKSARSLFWTSRIICLKWSEPSSPHCSDRIVGASTGGFKNHDMCVLCPGSGAVRRTRDCKHEAQCLPAPLVRWRLGPTGHATPTATPGECPGCSLSRSQLYGGCPPRTLFVALCWFRALPGSLASGCAFEGNATAPLLPPKPMTARGRRSCH